MTKTATRTMYEIDAAAATVRAVEVSNYTPHTVVIRRPGQTPRRYEHQGRIKPTFAAAREALVVLLEHAVEEWRECLANECKRLGAVLELEAPVTVAAPETAPRRRTKAFNAGRYA